MNLYLLIGILGSITPIFDRYIVPKYDLNNLLFVRETVYALFLAILMFINKSTNIEKVKSISKFKLKDLLIFIPYFIIGFIYIYIMFYVFKRDIIKESLSQVTTVMMLITIIFTFLVDVLIFKKKFNNYNYLGIVIIFIGLYLLKFM